MFTVIISIMENEVCFKKMMYDRFGCIWSRLCWLNYFTMITIMLIFLNFEFLTILRENKSKLISKACYFCLFIEVFALEHVNDINFGMFATTSSISSSIYTLFLFLFVIIFVAGSCCSGINFPLFAFLRYRFI